MRREIQERTIGNFQGPIHAPDHWWQDNLNLERGSQAWLVIDPPDGKVPALTPEAQRRIAAQAEARKASGRGPADSFTDRSLYDRCITRGLPELDDAVDLRQLRPRSSRRPGYVVDPLRDDSRGARHSAGPGLRNGSTPFLERPRLGSNIQLDMGDARGRWEGDTLVVETTNFKPRSVYRNANAATLKLTERFRRVSPTQVRWTVTVEDPDDVDAAVDVRLPLTVDDVPLPSYECHEGNYGLKNILSAARAEEAAR